MSALRCLRHAWGDWYGDLLKRGTRWRSWCRTCGMKTTRIEYGEPLTWQGYLIDPDGGLHAMPKSVVTLETPGVRSPRASSSRKAHRDRPA